MESERESYTELNAETAGQVANANPHWSFATRVIFRFAFVYLGLFTLTFPAGFFVPYTGYVVSWIFTFWGKAVPWFGAHVLHLRKPLALTFTGSGDKLFDWVQMLLILIVAVLATMIWSVLDRRRQNYATLHKWFRLWIRFSLATTMIEYGAMKAIPVQMSFPGLGELFQPYGRLTLMGVLWRSIGSSKAYEIFTGCTELLGGILLIFPRTTLMGALVSGAAMFQVFVLNMCYDVPVKLMSFHSILLALFLIAPDMQRLGNVLLFNRRIEPATMPPLFQRKWANWLALCLQVVFGLYMLGLLLNGNIQTYREYGAGAPKSPLYGIWTVDEFSVDGQARPPLITDKTCWRRVFFGSPEALLIQHTDDSFGYFPSKLDMSNKTIALTKSDDPKWKSDLAFQQPEPGKMTIDGTFDGQKIHAQLELYDTSKLRLLGRHFHWIKEHPYD